MRTPMDPLWTPYGVGGGDYGPLWTTYGPPIDPSCDDELWHAYGPPKDPHTALYGPPMDSLRA